MSLAALWQAWLKRSDGTPGPSLPAAASAATLSFPGTPLSFRAQIALGADVTADPGTWGWLDITDRLRFTPGIDIIAGRRDQSDVVETANMTVYLSNTDGYLTRRNPASPYFGLLSPNTPIWVQVDAGSGVKTRAELFVNSWPIRWPDKSGNDTIVAVQCSGVLRRLEQGSREMSALRRTITAAAVAPDYYAPLEDNADASPLEAVYGVSPTIPKAPLVQVAGATGVASKQYPVVDLTRQFYEPLGGPPSTPRITGKITTTGSGFLRVGFIFRGSVASPALATMCALDLIRDVSGSNYTVLMFAARPDGPVPDTFGVQVDAVVAVSDVNPFDGEEHYIEVTFTQNGGNIDVRLSVDYTHTSTGSTAATLEQPIRWDFYPSIGSLGETVDNTGATASIGQVVVYSDSASASTSFAGVAYKGERDYVRISRLCDEESIPYTSTAADGTRMGPQLIGRVLDLIRDAEAVSAGVLYEKRWGLAFNSEPERNNAPVALSLDFAAGQIAETPIPDDDDQFLRNRWTVSRSDGGEKTVEQTLTPVGTIAAGTYEDSASVNVEDDSLLQHQAGWRVHLGTVDEDRWPSIELNFASPAGRALIDQFCALPYGARAQIANPPSQMPPDPPDVVIEGVSEHLDPKLWTARLNTSPASIYAVHTVGGTGNLGRVDSKLSTLAAAIDTITTSLSVACTGVLWDTTESGFDINVEGERMTVTLIAGGSSPQTFTVTRSVNSVVKSHPLGARVSLWRPGVYALVG